MARRVARAIVESGSRACRWNLDGRRRGTKDGSCCPGVNGAKLARAISKVKGCHSRERGVPPISRTCSPCLGLQASKFGAQWLDVGGRYQFSRFGREFARGRNGCQRGRADGSGSLLIIDVAAITRRGNNGRKYDRAEIYVATRGAPSCLACDVR